MPSKIIIGTQRSGSNLLRLMLNQLPEIETPHPPHLLQIFTPLLTGYGSLDVKENFETLVNDVWQYIQVNPVAWYNFNTTPAQIINRYKQPSLTEIFRVVYEIKAEYKHARYWSCKSMANVYFLQEMEAGMQPFYIHLLRDVAASFKNAIVGEKHIYLIGLGA